MFQIIKYYKTARIQKTTHYINYIKLYPMIMFHHLNFWTIIVYHVLSSSILVTGHLLLWNGMTWVPDHQCDAATTKPELWNSWNPERTCATISRSRNRRRLLSQLLSWSTERHGTTRNDTERHEMFPEFFRYLSIRMRFCVEFQPHGWSFVQTQKGSFWISEVSEVVWGDLKEGFWAKFFFGCVWK